MAVPVVLDPFVATHRLGDRPILAMSGQYALTLHQQQITYVAGVLQRERVLLVRRVNVPEAVAMGREERVTHDGYAEQDPVRSPTKSRWQRGCSPTPWIGSTTRTGSCASVYNWPQQYERTLRWVAIHTAHDVHHHLLDMRRQFC